MLAERYRRQYHSKVNVKTKLLEAIQRNPQQVRFTDACKAAALLGFSHSGGKGSHRAYARAGEAVGLNFQNRAGFVPPYQARQLIEMIRKYGATTE
jgi:hypothetical protein